jgi:hypothetical protein
MTKQSQTVVNGKERKVFVYKPRRNAGATPAPHTQTGAGAASSSSISSSQTQAQSTVTVAQTPFIFSSVAAALPSITPTTTDTADTDSVKRVRGLAPTTPVETTTAYSINEFPANASKAVAAPAAFSSFWFPKYNEYQLYKKSNQIPNWRWRTFDPISVVELKYMQALAEILNKKDWWVKKDDEAIKKKWEEEMKQAKGERSIST